MLFPVEDTNAVLRQTRAESAQRSSVWVKSRAERQRYWMSRKVKQSLAAQLRLETSEPSLMKRTSGEQVH